MRTRNMINAGMIAFIQGSPELLCQLVHLEIHASTTNFTHLEELCKDAALWALGPGLAWLD